MKNWLNLRNGAAKDMAEPVAYREFASQLEFIPNTPQFIPQAGDICVTLGGQYNSLYGHVFMILAGSTVNTMNTLEQNTGNGDGKGEDDRTVARTRNYANILTFVRWKGIQSNTTITSNNTTDMELKKQMKDIINSDNRYDEETRRMLINAVDNGDMAYVLAFSGAFIRDELKAKQYTQGELEVAYNNLVEISSRPTFENYVAQQLPEVPAVPTQPVIDEDEVKELIKETAKRFNLNDWAMGWLTFGIDKWSIISALIASGAYYMQNNVDPQYHALIAYSAVAWSTLILVFFLYNKAKK
jgi:hypothetical protein